jgi:protoheme IX farnesyltransferase
MENTASRADRSAYALPGDYFQLLKPRVMSLVVFTALTGLVSAPTRIHPVLAAVAVLCIAVGAGAAGALNMALEGETDALMRRTRGRPVAAGRVKRGEALAFGTVLSAFAVMLMGMAVNWVAAGLLALTIVYYAWFYTLVLKRRTPQNIVIGGAAGAFPPVIGWAAATGATSLDAWLLFLIIFLWTPPHSWALALYTSDDYAKAGIPMMPVARGAASTRLQILLYSLVLAPVAMAPVLTGLGGWLYGVVAGVGGLAFLGLAWRVYRSRAGEVPGEREEGLYDVKLEARAARNLFAFSILWLSALFAALLVEHGLMKVAA